MVLAIVLILLAAVLLGLWKLFEKAGIPGWKAIVPGYNLYIIVTMVNKPWWWVFYLIIPLIGQIIGLGVLYEFLSLYGKKKSSDLVICALLPFVYLPMIGFNKEVIYKAAAPRVDKKDSVHEWSEAIGFAVIAASLIRWLIMEAYTIPTPSMENTLLVGDFLFVSKFHYGTRTPKTPIQVPLTHQKIWFTDLPSYSKAVQLPTYRLPGFSSVKREDVVVFNVPPRSLNDGIDYPIDLKTNYIKRCVAVSGDVLTIVDGQVIVNGQPLTNPPKMQRRYVVSSTDKIADKNLEKLELDPDDFEGGGRNDSYPEPARPDNKHVEYVMYLSKAKAEELKSVPYITSVVEIAPISGDDGRAWPDSKYTRWNSDNYGPLTIPKEGMTIAINDSTLSIYGDVISLYDYNENVEMSGGKLKIDGKEVTEYTFKQNYYFMMGDNRQNSWDSRFWGFVPEDHIVGKAFFIWLSVDKYASWTGKIRWSRFFNLIH